MTRADIFREIDRVGVDDWERFTGALLKAGGLTAVERTDLGRRSLALARGLLGDVVVGAMVAPLTTRPKPAPVPGQETLTNPPAPPAEQKE